MKTVAFNACPVRRSKNMHLGYSHLSPLFLAICILYIYMFLFLITWLVKLAHEI